MKFLALREAFQRAETKQVSEVRLIPAPPPEPENQPPPLFVRERVVSGEISRDPINRQAALLLAKAPWWAHPVTEKPSKPEPKPKPKKKTMSKVFTADENIHASQKSIPNGSYVSEAGVRCTTINGVDYVYIDDIHMMICNEIAKLPKETTPMVKSAQDARRIVAELCEGLGGDMERFHADAKRYLDGIRATRMAMVTEASQMVGPLKEVRQFFLGQDYKDEIARLREFVDLCERLHKLKESGFLDNVADTMLRLAVR